MAAKPPTEGLNIMTELMQANANWRSRPDDERFTDLDSLDNAMRVLKDNSRQRVVSSRAITFQPAAEDDIDNLMIINQATGKFAKPTHSAFGKLATLAGMPAGYARTIPAPLAADCMNYGMKHARAVEDVGLMFTRYDDAPTDIVLRSANGPQYGRIWNSQLSGECLRRFGDGVTGDWKVPGEFGKAVTVTKANTTLFAGETSMFIFLADEVNRIEVPGRRNGKSGSMARGFFVWNSETGDGTIGAAWFLFDYVCCNRIVWGVGEYSEKRIRHTVSAPDKWLEAVTPVINRLADYSQSSEKIFLDPIKAAQAAKVDNVKDFLRNRFNKNSKLSARTIESIDAAHVADEGRPMESLWDITTGITAYARSVANQDQRVALETEAGAIMALAA